MIVAGLYTLFIWRLGIAFFFFFLFLSLFLFFSTIIVCRHIYLLSAICGLSSDGKASCVYYSHTAMGFEHSMEFMGQVEQATDHPGIGFRS